jgi:hypothetical protein
MTKTYMFAARIGGDHVADLHLLLGYDHPIDEQFHQLSSLFEGRLGEPSTNPLAEILYGDGHPGEFHPLAGLSLKLPFLSHQRSVSLFEILTAPLVLGQWDHLPEIRLGQPLQLPPESGSALAQVLLAGLQLLRQPTGLRAPAAARP